MKPRLILIPLLLMILTNCNKKEDYQDIKKDFRDKYLGKYNFTTITTEVKNYPNGETWEHYEFSDTLLFLGLIEKFEDKKLKIVYLNNTTSPNFERDDIIQIDGVIYPTLKSNDTLTYLDFINCYGYDIRGHFKNDSIFISYGLSNGRAGWDGTNIIGVKFE